MCGMAYYDCDFKEVDILEVKSVSDMISAFKTSAADAAKLMGGDDIAVFSPRLGLMAGTSQYDLEEPVTTSQTVVFSVDDAQCKWPDPPEYISDIVFELRGPSDARLATEFQTFSDENATPSASLEYYRKRFAESEVPARLEGQAGRLPGGYPGRDPRCRETPGRRQGEPGRPGTSRRGRRTAQPYPDGRCRHPSRTPLIFGGFPRSCMR